MATTVKMYAKAVNMSGLSIQGREVGGGTVAGFDVPIDHIEEAKSHGLTLEKPAGTPPTTTTTKAPEKAPEPEKPATSAPHADMVESVGETISKPRGPRSGR